MLNLTRDTAGDIYLRMNGDTCLSNLSVVVNPSGIDGGTRATHFTVEHFGEFKQLVETFF